MVKSRSDLARFGKRVLSGVVQGIYNLRIWEYNTPIHEMMLEIRSTYRASSAQSERDVFLRLSQCDLLVLDDIDKSNYSISEHQALQTLINQRYRNQKPTTFITTLSSQRFCAVLGDVALDRRHQGHLLWIECTWPNFRESG